MPALLVRALYLPFFLVGGNGAAILLVQAGYPGAWLLPLVLGFIGLSFAAEWALPYDRVFNEPLGDRGRDFCHALVNEGASVLTLALFPSIAAHAVLWRVWPVEAPLWQQLLVAVFVADVGITMAHHASHRISMLWRLHAVHHSVKRMYGFNGLMKHPLHQLLETAAGTTPLLLAGVPFEVLQLLVVAVVLQLLLQHSNVAYFTGPLDRILAVNTVHRFHHLASEKEGNVNFGLFTTWTDLVLGTAHGNDRRVIRSGDLGIEGRPDYPVGYLAQLAEPFRAGAAG